MSFSDRTIELVACTDAVVQAAQALAYSQQAGQQELTHQLDAALAAYTAVRQDLTGGTGPSAGQDTAQVAVQNMAQETAQDGDQDVGSPVTGDASSALEARVHQQVSGTAIANAIYILLSCRNDLKDAVIEKSVHGGTRKTYPAAVIHMAVHLLKRIPRLREGKAGHPATSVQEALDRLELAISDTTGDELDAQLDALQGLIQALETDAEG